MADEHECERCGAWMRDGQCGANCGRFQITLDEAHRLLHRTLTHWMYGVEDKALHHDLEVWCRVAGPPERSNR